MATVTAISGSPACERPGCLLRRSEAVPRAGQDLRSRAPGSQRGPADGVPGRVLMMAVFCRTGLRAARRSIEGTRARALPGQAQFEECGAGAGQDAEVTDGERRSP